MGNDQEVTTEWDALSLASVLITLWEVLSSASCYPKVTQSLSEGPSWELRPPSLLDTLKSQPRLL